MRSAEMGCRMSQKNLISLEGQREGWKDVAGRLDGDCRQAKQFYEETFWRKGMKGECEEKKRRACIDWELDIGKGRGEGIADCMTSRKLKRRSMDRGQDSKVKTRK